MAVSVLSTFSPAEIHVAEKSAWSLFTWTLTHFTPAFSAIRPVFRSRKQLEEQLHPEISEDLSEEIVQIAVGKINNEWRAWVRAHEGYPFDEDRLDNMLMRVLYSFVLKRDGIRCVLCSATSQSDDPPHHPEEATPCIHSSLWAERPDKPRNALSSAATRIFR